MTTVQLESSDGKLFIVDIHVASSMGTIKGLLHACGVKESDDHSTIPLPNVNSYILALVLEWAKMHHGKPEAIKRDYDLDDYNDDDDDDDNHKENGKENSQKDGQENGQKYTAWNSAGEFDVDYFFKQATVDKRDKPISKRNAKFLNVEQSTLFELITAANYLNLQSLLTIGCRTVANMIKGKSADEIREYFHIDMYEQEEEEEEENKKTKKEKNNKEERKKEKAEEKEKEKAAERRLKRRIKTSTKRSKKQ